MRSCSIKNFTISVSIHSTVQSHGRDFGSPAEADYAILVQTKARARELIIQWIFDAIDEEPTTQAPPTTFDPIPAEIY